MKVFRSSRARWIALVVAGFFVASALVYGTAVTKSEFVHWDDGMLVYENPAIRSITPATIGYIFTHYDPELYIPLTFFSYQVDYQIGGIQPFQYHLTSFLFHTLNAVLVAWFITLFFKGGQKGRPWLGIFCGLLFLLHPLHTEAVLWVSGRKDLLSGFFFLLTLIYWLRWHEHRTQRILLFSITFFVLALLSKVMAITLPVILLLLDWRNGVILSSTKDDRRTSWFVGLTTTARPYLPYFAIAILFGLIGLGGKTGVVASSTLSDKILMAGKSSVFYIQKILWPDSFSLLYPYNGAISIGVADFFVPVIFWLVVGLIAILLLKKTRDFAFGLLFYLITVGPTFINFAKGDLDIYFASDRYAYIPSIGIVIAVVSLALLVYRHRPVAWMRQLGAGLAVLMLIGCGIKAHAQSAVWLNTTTLFENVIRLYPDASYVAYNNLGNTYRLDKRYDEAVAKYQQSLKIREHPKTLANLGAAYRNMGRYDDAFAQYQRALVIDPQNKVAHFGLGLVYAELKKYPEAEKEYLAALAIDPTYEEVYTDLGVIYMDEGKVQQAVDAYRKAISFNPFFPTAHYNLAIALTQLRQVDEAIDEYQTTVQLAPGSVAARINLGLLLYNSGDRDGARAQFQAILRIDPNNRAAQSALQQMGQ